jgi:hypothetical protein
MKTETWKTENSRGRDKSRNVRVKDGVGDYAHAREFLCDDNPQFHLATKARLWNRLGPVLETLPFVKQEVQFDQTENHPGARIL